MLSMFTYRHTCFSPVLSFLVIDQTVDIDRLISGSLYYHTHITDSLKIVKNVLYYKICFFKVVLERCWFNYMILLERVACGAVVVTCVSIILSSSECRLRNKNGSL